jgi:triacylglycerol lipase
MIFPFDPSTKSFSLTNAMGCGLAAQLAYADASTVDSTFRGWGFDAVKSFASPRGPIYDTQAFVGIRHDMVLVAFRGTEPRNIKDWLTDGEIALLPTPLGHVHAGFWRAFGSVWPAMLGDIKGIPRLDSRSLWITGHSLGAALSTLAAASCHDAGLAVAGHYNFGSPRVGDSAFVNVYDERYAANTFRFVNNNDIVPRVPPRELSYRHVDFRKYFDAHFHLVSDARMLDLLLDSFEGSLQGMRKLFAQVGQQPGDEKQFPLPDFLEDHRMANYITCLERNS